MIRFLIICLLALPLSSCSIFNAEGEKLKVSARWNRQLAVPPFDLAKTKIYLRVKNSSGSELGEIIKAELRSAIVADGYLLTESFDEADITVRADVHFFGESKGDMKHYGSVYGGLAGAGLGGAFGNRGRRTETAIIAGVIGVAVGYMADLFAREDIYDLVATVTLNKRVRNGWEKQNAMLMTKVKKRSLTEEEAAPALKARMVRAISNILP